MNRGSAIFLAACTWSAIALAAGTGCIPIYVPSVEQDITTGDRLRAIETARQTKAVAYTKVPPAPPPAPGKPVEWHEPPKTPCTDAELDAIRTELLSVPPSMGARIALWRDAPASDYSGWDPGLLEPVDRERRDLERARDAGILTSAQFAELSALLDDQARRQIVRHGWELGGDRAIWRSSFSHILGSTCEPLTPAARQHEADEWVIVNVERIRGARFSFRPIFMIDPGAWLREGDIWIDPRPSPRAAAPSPTPAATPPIDPATAPPAVPR